MIRLEPNSSWEIITMKEVSRESEGFVVAMKWSNHHGAKGPCHKYMFQTKMREPIVYDYYGTNVF